MCSAPKPELESQTPGSLGVMGLTKVVVRVTVKKNKMTRMMRIMRMVLMTLMMLMMRMVKMVMRRTIFAE